MKRFLFLIFLFPLSLFGQNCDDVPALNQQIVDLADKKLKKKVGTGECWDLAKYLLNTTNAQWDGLYEYGKLIDRDEECIYPGDIIQFEKIKLKWEEDGSTYQESMGHHTAIVYEVINSNTVVLIHQNTGQHGRKVGLSTFRFDAIVKGKLMIYRPQPKD